MKRALRYLICVPALGLFGGGIAAGQTIPVPQNLWRPVGALMRIKDAEFHNRRDRSAERIAFRLLRAGEADIAVSMTLQHCSHNFSVICGLGKPHQQWCPSVV